MASGFALELRCGSCHSSTIFPTGERASAELLGELYVSPTMTWMTWTGPYRHDRDKERNLLPGPRQIRGSGPGTTWQPVPREGIEHVCRSGRHRIALTERELWRLVRALPAEAAVLWLPGTSPAPAQMVRPPVPSVAAPLRRRVFSGR